MQTDDDRRSVPRVSVVMATYNYGQYIAQAIQSVVDQVYTDWELVIVDDGSTDNTTEVVDRFSNDPRIRYLRQENQGQPQAKNAGIRLSQGSLIAFLDADDAWLPSKLARQVALFDADAELGAAYTGMSFMDSDGRVFAHDNREMVRGHVLDVAIMRTIPPFSSSMIRREVLDDVGLFDETIPLAIDYELWLRVALTYRFDYVAEPLLLYRTGHANLSRRSEERRRIVLEQILPKFLAREGVRERLGPRLIGEAYADTYINQGRELRPTSLRGALACHLRALWLSPWMWEAWRSTFRCCLPDTLVHRIKSIVRKSRIPKSATAESASMSKSIPNPFPID
ncbi:MAG TPA: glycosyltransferase [Lacipirellulaceae bacterium]